MGQTMPKIVEGNALGATDTLANVATNKADVAASKLNIDNTDIYPNSTTTQHLSAADAIIHGAFKSGSLDVGAGGVSVSSAPDGATPTTGLIMTGSSLQLIKSNVAQVTLDGTTGDATFKGTIVAGSSISGTMTAGSISVATGGVTISNDGGTSGIYIGSNTIYCKYGGATTVSVDGTTGVITASKFAFTADADSSINLTSGSHTFADGITVGATTLGTIRTNAATSMSLLADIASDGKITPIEKLAAKAEWDAIATEGQATTGTLIVQAAALGVNSGMFAVWYYQLDYYLNTYLTVFANMTATTSVTRTIWDNYWNQYYNARTALINAFAQKGFDVGASAIKPGGGVQVDGSKYITAIDMSSGIVIKTSTSTAKTQMTADGIAIYDSAGTVVVQADHTNGLWVNNANATPGLTERASLAYAGTEKGYLAGTSTHLKISTQDTGTKLDLLSAGDMLVYSSSGVVQITGTSSVIIGPNICVGASDGPRIAATASPPSEGDTTTEPLGSIRMSTGGSLWTVYLDGSTKKWTQIHTHHND